MDENNLLNDDFTPDNNDPYNETDSKKKKNIIMYVGAGIGVILLLFLIFGTGKKEKKEKSDVELQTAEQTIKADNLKQDEEIEQQEQNQNTQQQGYEYNDEYLNDDFNSNPQNNIQGQTPPSYYETDEIDNSYGSIKREVPDIYSHDSIENTSENTKDKGKKSGIGFKSNSVQPVQPVSPQNQENQTQNPLQNESKTDKDKKNEFINSSKRGSFILGQQLNQPVSIYELKAGSIIPITLTTRINSDLPSDITGLVREDVYNTVNGKFLLIPKGSKVYGTYDSNISYGQNRLLMVWQRIQMPNGFTINLENMQGVDMLGQSGVKGNVNNHTLKLLRSVVLSSLFNFASNGIKVNYNAGKSGSDSKNQVILGNVADDTSGKIQNIGDKIVERDLDLQPTIIIKEGARMNIFVNKDMLLYPYNKLKTAGR